MRGAPQERKKGAMRTSTKSRLRWQRRAPLAKRINTLSIAGARARLTAWAKDHADDWLLLFLLRAMIVIALAVVALDYSELQARLRDQPASEPREPQLSATPDNPVTITEMLPSIRRHEPRGKPPLPMDARLGATMSFDLHADGRLLAVGTIRPGTGKNFAAEIEKRGSYVRMVVLHSP